MTIRPLEGIRIVSLAVNVPGPVAAQSLQGLGASVIKIEPPAGDPLAHISPPWYASLTAGQKIISLNLKNRDEFIKLGEMLKDADLLITSTRPSSLRNLSLTWEGVHAKFPRLCQVALVGYSPPYDNRAGHDLMYSAYLGLLKPPYMPRTLLVDMAGAERLVSSALALLYARERGGEAGFCQVALSECAAVFGDPARYGLTTPEGLLGGSSPRYNLYETKEGWIAVATLEDHFWLAMNKELGLSGNNTSYEDLRCIFITKTALEWEEWATTRDIPLTAVRIIS